MHEQFESPFVRIGAGASTNVTPYSAADHAADLCTESLGGTRPALLLAFATEAHGADFEPLCARLRERMEPRAFLGVVGSGAISSRGAVESGHGLAVLAIHPRAAEVRIATAERPTEELAEKLALSARAVTFMFAGSEHPTLEPLLTRIDKDSGDSRAPIVGAPVRAGPVARTRFVADDRAMTAGACGASLAGDFEFDAWVSQGCAAFGPTMVVTRAQGDQILELGGLSAVDAIHAAVQTLGEARRKTLAGGLFLGRAVSEYKEHFGRDDFLIRQLQHVNTDIGAVSVSEPFRVGQTVRLHARDATAALADLDMVLGVQKLRGQALGAVMFSSFGRGEAMHGASPHEAAAVIRALSPPEAGEQLAKAGRRIDPASRPAVPMSGLFGAMEIGPIGSGPTLRSRVHAQSTVLGVFREKTATG